MIGSEVSHDFKLGGKEHNPLFLLILIYILCLWLAVPPLEQDTLCRKEEHPTRDRECRSKWRRIANHRGSCSRGGCFLLPYSKFVTFDSNTTSEKLRCAKMLKLSEYILKTIKTVDVKQSLSSTGRSAVVKCNLPLKTRSSSCATELLKNLIIAFSMRCDVTLQNLLHCTTTPLSMFQVVPGGGPSQGAGRGDGERVRVRDEDPLPVPHRQGGRQEGGPRGGSSHRSVPSRLQQTTTNEGKNILSNMFPGNTQTRFEFWFVLTFQWVMKWNSNVQFQITCTFQLLPGCNHNKLFTLFWYRNSSSLGNQWFNKSHQKNK